MSVPDITAAFDEAVHKVYVPNGAPVYGVDNGADVWGRHALGTNCYTYALNIPEHGWGRPGSIMLRMAKIPGKLQIGGDEFNITHDSVKEGLEEDGLIFLGEDKKNVPDEGHVIAAVVSPLKGSHILRRDCGGTWSHKFAKGLPTNVDVEGRPIMDPMEAVSSDYYDFVGYFRVPEAGLAYYPRLELSP